MHTNLFEATDWMKWPWDSGERAIKRAQEGAEEGEPAKKKRLRWGESKECMLTPTMSPFTAQENSGSSWPAEPKHFTPLFPTSPQEIHIIPKKRKLYHSQLEPSKNFVKLTVQMEGGRGRHTGRRNLPGKQGEPQQHPQLQMAGRQV